MCIVSPPFSSTHKKPTILFFGVSFFSPTDRQPHKDASSGGSSIGLKGGFPCQACKPQQKIVCLGLGKKHFWLLPQPSFFTHRICPRASRRRSLIQQLHCVNSSHPYLIALRADKFKSFNHFGHRFAQTNPSTRLTEVKNLSIKLQSLRPQSPWHVSTSPLTL